MEGAHFRVPLTPSLIAQYPTSSPFTLLFAPFKAMRRTIFSSSTPFFPFDSSLRRFCPVRLTVIQGPRAGSEDLGRKVRTTCFSPSPHRS
jgi:hypothetical protein